MQGTGSAGFHNSSGVHNQDVVGVDHRRESMSDQNDGALESGDIGLNLGRGDGVEVAGVSLFPAGLAP